MSGPLRILHVIASHRWTGAAEPAARLAASEIAAGHTVLMAMTPGHSLEKQARALGVETSADVAFERSYWPHRKLRDLRSLRRLIADFHPDIVHAHLTHDHILSGVAIGPTSPQTPALIRTFHREEPPRSDAFTRALVLRRTAGLIAVSEAMAAQLRETYEIGPDRVVCVAGDIDTARFAPSPGGARMREKWGIPADAPVAGIVGRLRPSRGIPWLLKAAETALAAMPNAWLVVCGRGSYKEQFLADLESHPCRDRIVYAGYVSGADLEDSYNAFDVSLILRPGNDGSCRAALEAMACAKPVVGGDIGAIHDLLAGEGCGWLVPLDDAPALAAALRSALSDLSESRRRGAAARARIVERHDAAAMTRATIEFYRATIERKNAPLAARA